MTTLFIDNIFDVCLSACKTQELMQNEFMLSYPRPENLETSIMTVAVISGLGGVLTCAGKHVRGVGSVLEQPVGVVRACIQLRGHDIPVQTKRVRYMAFEYIFEMDTKRGFFRVSAFVSCVDFTLTSNARPVTGLVPRYIACGLLSARFCTRWTIFSTVLVLLFFVTTPVSSCIRAIHSIYSFDLFIRYSML